MSEREAQIREVVEHVLKLRSSGEEPRRQQLLSDHASLMPELGRELDKLDMIHRVVGTANDGLANTERHEPENKSTIVHGGADTGGTTHKGDRPSIPDYELIAPIGRGGFGTVWIGRNRVDEAYVAIKTFPADREVELDGVRVYKKFAKDSRHLIPIEHVGTAGDSLYYVMPLADDARESSLLVPEHYEPKTLQWFLANRLTLPAEQVAEIGCQVADSLVELHRNGVTHCDVKPANVMQFRGVWMLGDLGLIDRTDRLTADRGTRAFWPPEGPQDPSADVFALGKTLYLLLSGLGGHAEFAEFLQGEVDVSGAADVAGPLVRIIGKACADRPADRYRSSQHMLDELRALKLRPVPSKAPRYAEWFAGVMATIVLLVVVADWLQPHDEHPSSPAMDTEHHPSEDSHEPEGGPVARPSDRLEAPRLELTLTADDGRDAQQVGRLVSRITMDSDLPLDREQADFSMRPGDQVSVFMESPNPIYCFLLVLRADGTVERLWPHDPGVRSTTRVGPDGDARVLNFRWKHTIAEPAGDGRFLQLYVLISGDTAFRQNDPQWPRFAKELDWQPVANRDVWYFHADHGQKWPRRIEMFIPRNMENTLRSLPWLLGGQTAIGIAVPIESESVDDR